LATIQPATNCIEDLSRSTTNTMERQKKKLMPEASAATMVAAVTARTRRLACFW